MNTDEAFAIFYDILAAGNNGRPFFCFVWFPIRNGINT